MEVTTLSDKLAVLDSNALVATLTEGLAEAEKKKVANIFFRVEADGPVDILSG